MIRDSNVKSVLTNDGLGMEALDHFHKYENTTTISLEQLKGRIRDGLMGS